MYLLYIIYVKLSRINFTKQCFYFKISKEQKNLNKFHQTSLKNKIVYLNGI